MPHFGGLTRQSVSIMAGLSLILALVPTVFAQSPKAVKPDFRDIQDRIRWTTQTVELAQIDSVTLTNEMLRIWLSVAKPQKAILLSTEQIMALPPDYLADVIRNLGFYVMAKDEALKAKDFVSSGLAETLAAQRHDILKERFLAKMVNDKNPPMNEEQALRYYKEHLSEFTQPFNFAMQAIFLSTYKPHSLRQGETLDATAREVVGDPQAVGRILESATSQPFERSPDRSNPLWRFLPPPMLSKGMIVWVPMKPEERRAVGERMKKVQAELKAGGDFESLAKTYSDEAPRVARPYDRPLAGAGTPVAPKRTGRGHRHDRGPGNTHSRNAARISASEGDRQDRQGRAPLQGSSTGNDRQGSRRAPTEGGA